MNVIPDNCTIVKELAENKIIIYSNVKETISILLSWGFSESTTEYIFFKNIQNNEERIEIINKLIDLNALFSYGDGWAPSQLLEYYKEKGVLKNNFKEISWKSAKEYVIREL